MQFFDMIKYFDILIKCHVYVAFSKYLKKNDSCSLSFVLQFFEK